MFIYRGYPQRCPQSYRDCPLPRILDNNPIGLRLIFIIQLASQALMSIWEYTDHGQYTKSYVRSEIWNQITQVPSINPS